MSESSIIELQARIAYLEDHVDAQDLALRQAFVQIDTLRRELKQLANLATNQASNQPSHGHAEDAVSTLDARHFDEDTQRLSQLAAEKPPHY